MPKLSGLNGTAAGVGEAFSPLIGIWAPTFSACELAAAFLLPFVAIRLVAGDRQSGALKLELQHPMPPLARVGAKALVLLGGWLVASLRRCSAPSCSGSSYGGSALCAGARDRRAWPSAERRADDRARGGGGALTEHPSTAAILTLASPSARGSSTSSPPFRAALGAAGRLHADRDGRGVPARAGAARCRAHRGSLLIATRTRPRGDLDAHSASPSATRRRIGRRSRRWPSLRRVVGCTFVRASWDVSENRAQLVSRARTKRRSAQIRAPLRIEAHLAPEDPRRVDLEHRALSKLRRVLPRSAACITSSATSIGLFEQTAPITTARSGTSSADAGR